MRNDNTHDMADDFAKWFMMACAVMVALIFCLGAAVGSAITWGLS